MLLFQCPRTSRNCVVHYDGIDLASSTVRPLTKNAFETLLANKSVWERLAEDHLHKKQADNLPVTWNESYGYHPQCFKKFTMAVSIERKRKRDEDNARADSKKRRTSRTSEGSKQIFPKMCICKSKNDIKVKGKRQSPHKITLQSAEQMIKVAAEKRKDVTMISLVNQEHLLEREFMIHDKCYSDYT